MHLSQTNWRKINDWVWFAFIRGIVGFTDVNKMYKIQLMARIMDYASDIGVLIMQHAEDYDCQNFALMMEK